MSIHCIRQRMDSILNFMQPHWEFVNCHMVNYLTDNHWQQYVPIELRQEVEDLPDVADCIETVFWNSDENVRNLKFPEFHKFLKISVAHRLENFDDVIKNVNDLQHVLGKPVPKPQLSIKEFMSEKKRHEVEITASIINDLIQNNMSADVQKLFVVDAGDGKGYLSSRLALQYDLQVLGIDCNESNTGNALERNKKLQRVWNGLTARAELEVQGITPPRRGRKKSQQFPTTNTTTSPCLENYKTTSNFITPNLDINGLLRTHFSSTLENTSNEPPNYCLTGLHTCGNLASTCLQVFHAQPNCKLLCNIGCCYHLIKERFSGQEFFGNKVIMEQQTDYGFPMSQYLKDKHFKMGRNARMLAAQSIERCLSVKELPSITLFYRALLEVIICQQQPKLKNTVQVGKIRKFSDFKDYIKICAEKCELKITNDADSILENYAGQKSYLDLFYLLRMTFAPILESLILLDRLLYLKELGHEQSYLVSVFDAVVSPRHFGIIAIKK